MSSKTKDQFLENLGVLGLLIAERIKCIDSKPDLENLTLGGRSVKANFQCCHLFLSWVNFLQKKVGRKLWIPKQLRHPGLIWRHLNDKMPESSAVYNCHLVFQENKSILRCMVVPGAETHKKISLNYKMNELSIKCKSTLPTLFFPYR